jgi:patatin-like phospholipase/acyl hydrolase
MFDKAKWRRRYQYKFEDERLANKLKEVFGEDTNLGTDKLKTFLLVVMRNATTDSPWPISNNPQAKYNCDLGRDDCNLRFPLWQLVRASTAAPTYFPPEVIKIGTKTFIFVDGGVTMYNNPAFQLFLMATVEPYKLQWPTGEDQILLVSIGTGTSPKANLELAPGEMNLLYNASSIPSALMFAASNEQDFLCRVFGKCVAGDMIDREVGDMIAPTAGDVIDANRSALPRLFTYARYNAELTREGLNGLGLYNIEPEDVQQLDSIDHMIQLQDVGKAVAERKVSKDHFDGFLR